MAVSTRTTLLFAVALVLIGYASCGDKKSLKKCDPRDDCSGHVSGCDGSENKVCLSGWKGENCNEAVDTEAYKSCGGQACLASSADAIPTCFNGMCCCPPGRIGATCNMGDLQELNNDPCGKNTKCVGHCGRITTETIDTDFNCDDGDAETTTPASGGDGSSKKTTDPSDTGSSTTLGSQQETKPPSAATVSAISLTLMTVLVFGLLTM